MMKRSVLTLTVFIYAACGYADPVLLDHQTVNNGDGSVTFMTQPRGWWRDNEGVVRRTEESLRRSDGGVWDVKNISAPHKVYAATDAAWWRVDPPAGEAAGFEIQFATVSLFRFIDSENWVEKTIDWARVAIATTYDQNVINYPLFSNTNLYVISTPNGYKSNFFLSDPALIPSPASAAYFGADVDLETVYFAVRYSVSKWPDSEMVVDGETMGPGGIDAGYSAVFGDDIWMLPTKAYRNVTGFNGVSWRDAEDESYVYYVFDRLAQEILVLAPYTLFVGAQNVVIDPTTWTNASSGSNPDTRLWESNPTTNYGSATTVTMGTTYSGGYKMNTGLFAFDSIPQVGTVSDVSATLKLTYGGTSYGAAVQLIFGRVLRPWVEAQATHNIWSTGNAWETAGCRGANDYDTSTTIPYSWTATTSITIYNNAVLNAWCSGWLDGTYPNYGIVGLENPVAERWGTVYSDEGTTPPLLVITYTALTEFTLASLSSEVDVDVLPGSLVATFTIPEPTTALVLPAALVNDVSLEVVLEDGTHLIVGQGETADYSWDTYSATSLINGGSIFVLANTSYTLEKAAACALYFESSLTGYVETRSFGLSPLGAASLAGDLQDVLDNVLVNRDVIWGVTPAVSNNIAAVTSDIQASYGMIASVSTNVSNVGSALGVEHAALATGIDNASDSIEAHLSAVAADVDILVATGNFLNDNVKVSRAYYNTDTALTNGEFQRDVPANALSHVESRWLPVADVIAENWAAYVKQEYVIYSYPDSAAGTVLASHLIPSSTAPTERTWTDKGASLW